MHYTQVIFYFSSVLDSNSSASFSGLFGCGGVLRVLCVRAVFGWPVKEVFVCICIFLGCDYVFFLNVIFGLKSRHLD